jgi:hypothetical protein
MSNRLPLRQARVGISAILSSGKTVAVGQRYQPLRGFVVGVPAHNEYNSAERRKALAAAKAAFLAALAEELKD